MFIIGPNEVALAGSARVDGGRTTCAPCIPGRSTWRLIRTGTAHLSALAGRLARIHRDRGEAKELQERLGRRYSGRGTFMPLRVVLCLSLLAATAAPALADARDEAKQQAQFGVEVARRGLWREAIYRWERAIEIDPTYAAALNNLAVAYEHEGQLDKAREAYERALNIEPNNPQIRQNYDLFKEINDRTAARNDKP
jgi:tetratricopeptide (TPR) repeat protein